MSKVSVYLDNGIVCEYDVKNPIKGREHASEIIKDGYRSTSKAGLEWFPPHRIKKVKVEGSPESNYKDNKRAT